MSLLLGIAIKTRKFQPMHLLESAELSPEQGLTGDWRGQPGKRQLTVLGLSDWQAACVELGVELPWTARRANLLLPAVPKQPGSLIRLGESLLEVTGECDPCERMEAQQPGLFAALACDWRGGITCRVLQGGRIHINMPVTIEAAAHV